MSFGYKIYFSDRFTNRVFEWNPDTGDYNIVAGDSEATNLSEPYGVIMGDKGVTIADNLHQRICYLQNGQLKAIHVFDPSGERDSKFIAIRNHPCCPTDLFQEQGKKTFIVTYYNEGTIYRIHPDGRLKLILGLPPTKAYRIGKCPQSIPSDQIINSPLYLPSSFTCREDGAIFFIEGGYPCVRDYRPDQDMYSIFPVSLIGAFLKGTVPQDMPTDEYYPVYPASLAVNRELLYMGETFHQRVFEIDLQAKYMRTIANVETIGTDPFRPSALALGPDNVLWILDLGARKVYALEKKDGKWEKLDVVFNIPSSNPEGVEIYGGSGLVCVA